MNSLHPKLNWDQFQKLRAQRRRRKRLLVFFLLSALGVSLTFVILHFVEPQASQNKPTQQPVSVFDAPTVKKDAQNITQNIKNDSAVSISTTSVDAASEKLASQKPISSTTAQNGGGNTLTQQAVVPTEKITDQNLLPSTPSQNGGGTTATQQIVVAAVPSPSQKDAEAAENKQQLPDSESTLDAAHISAIEPKDSGDLMEGSAQITPQTVGNPAATASKTKSRLHLPLYLHVQWMPWHAPELEVPALPAVTNLEYVPLNSFSTALQLQILERKKWRLVVAPQYQEQRFQTQYQTANEDFTYAPNSIVGYVQLVKQIFPVYGDTVQGTYYRNVRTNGVIREFVLPVAFEAVLFDYKNLSLKTGGAVGLQYIAMRKLQWIETEALQNWETPAPKWGVQAGLNLSLQYRYKGYAWGVQWQTNYRSARLPMQKLLRNQFGVFMEVPLLK